MPVYSSTPGTPWHGVERTTRKKENVKDKQRPAKIKRKKK
tara:strand:+ start:294 stop:413 length:120 start_codon:yes stop_codon:yes gene_type:complete